MHDPWRLVTGPAGAYLLTARRLGWKVLSARTVQTAQGFTIDLCRFLPEFPRKIAVQDAEWASYKQLVAKPGAQKPRGLENEVWLVPLRELLVGRKALPHKQRCYLRSVATGCQWPQQKLFEKGLVADPFCKICGYEEGTLAHRHWRCPVGEGCRRQLIDKKLSRALEKQGVEDGDFYDRIFVARPVFAFAASGNGSRFCLGSGTRARVLDGKDLL